MSYTRDVLMQPAPQPGGPPLVGGSDLRPAQDTTAAPSWHDLLATAKASTAHCGAAGLPSAGAGAANCIIADAAASGGAFGMPHQPQPLRRHTIVLGDFGPIGAATLGSPRPLGSPSYQNQEGSSSSGSLAFIPAAGGPGALGSPLRAAHAHAVNAAAAHAAAATAAAGSSPDASPHFGSHQQQQQLMFEEAMGDDLFCGYFGAPPGPAPGAAAAAAALLDGLASAAAARPPSDNGGPTAMLTSGEQLALARMAVAAQQQQVQQQQQAQAQAQQALQQSLLSHPSLGGVASLETAAAGQRAAAGLLSAAAAAAAAASANPLPPGVPKGATSVGGGLFVPKSSSLYVKNLPVDADKCFLYERFAPYGAIMSVKVLTDPDTGGCRGVGFVNFAEHDAAVLAMKALHGAKFGDRLLHVSLQTPRIRAVI